MQGGRGRGRFTRGRKKERGKAPFLRLRSGLEKERLEVLGFLRGPRWRPCRKFLLCFLKKHFGYPKILIDAGQIKKRKDVVEFWHFPSLKLCRISPALYFFPATNVGEPERGPIPSFSAVFASIKGESSEQRQSFACCVS